MSSSNFAIEIKHLVKRFRAWESKPDRRLKAFLISALRFNFEKAKFHTVTVLNGIDFTVKSGEFVGIMGKNGIGKSTILRLMSRIYVPTSGSVKLSGKVVPLLELGAGFDPELTGYENIYLNAAIHGFKKNQIEPVIDKIIEFSELKDKINQLTRNYSSGMLVRLGFSIAAHLDFDILLLDEVLGVGDAGFIEKSIKKINELNSMGKTVILVTHNPEQVLNYCKRCIVINDKRVVFDGDPKKGIEIYNSIFSEEGARHANL